MSDISAESRLWITSDSALLCSVLMNPTPLASELQDTKPGRKPGKNAIVAISGTGCIAYSYTIPEASLARPTGRSDRWGYLLGDEGSGYGIGRETLRAVVLTRDKSFTLTPFHRAVLEGMGDPDGDDVISRMYDTRESSPKARIASLSRVTMRFAFPENEHDEGRDLEARQTVESAASSLAGVIANLKGRVAQNSEEEEEKKEDCVLIPGDSLLVKVPKFRGLVLEKLGVKIEAGGTNVRVVEDAGEEGAMALARLCAA
ncbi:hypothetical protein PM082_000044 [Marasmius tenuissimus]|nr:hypothetical protein PM082_000044 [Marasmius tenuissimus]